MSSRSIFVTNKLEETLNFEGWIDILPEQILNPGHGKFRNKENRQH